YSTVDNETKRMKRIIDESEMDSENEIKIDDDAGAIYFDRTENLEQFGVVWFDTDININNKDRATIRIKLREIIDYLQTFDNIELCEEYIRNVKTETVFLIISSKLADKAFKWLQEYA
ncbi:unnamed protein product, partial [Didymodactylos carnosus]